MLFNSDDFVTMTRGACQGHKKHGDDKKPTYGNMLTAPGQSAQSPDLPWLHDSLSLSPINNPTMKMPADPSSGTQMEAENGATVKRNM